MEARSVRKPGSIAQLPVNNSVQRSSSPSVKESGVDWITVTCRNPDALYQFREFGTSLLHTQSWHNGKVKPWSFMGFEGLRADGVAFGEQRGMSICRLSGPTADAYWSRAFELATNVSRLDLQVTVENVEDPAALILDHHRASVDHYSKFQNPPTVDLRMSNRTGNTLYYNTRASSRFGRVYDKGFESKMDHYQSCVRYEVQLNGRVAKQVAHRLSSSGCRASDIHSGVCGFFSKHLCTVPGTFAQVSLLSSPRSRTTDDRRLRWLATQVRGCVQELIEHGRGHEAVFALGLSFNHLGQLVQPTRWEE